MSSLINKTYLTYGLIALLLVSVVFSAFIQQANALTAGTFSSQATFTSPTSTTKWERVWVNTAGTSTYFTTSGIDGGTAVSNFKSVKLNNTDYTTTTTLSSLVGTAVTVTTPTGSTTKTDTLGLQPLGAANCALLRTGSTTFCVEYAATASSQLVGKQVNSITIDLKKTGAPTGTIIIAVFSSTGATQYQFGTKDVSTLTTSFVASTFTGAPAGYTITSTDSIGIFFNSGSAGNEAVTATIANDRYDGTVNTFVRTATGTQGAAAWTSVTGSELKFTLNFIYNAASANDDDGGVSFWENSGYVARGTSTNFDAVVSLNSGGNTIVAEKATTSSLLAGTNNIDTMDVLLSKTGSPTGTVTIGTFDSSGTLLSTLNTMEAASLTTTQTVYSFASATDISLAAAATQYIGVQFTGGSGGNSVNVGVVSADSFDGTTNSVRSVWVSSWTDTTTSDLYFRVIDTPQVVGDQEADAFFKADFGANVETGGVYVHFPSASKIPQEVSISTSTDDASYTVRATRTLIQSTGFQWIMLDAAYNIRYVKIIVTTWGANDFSMAIGEYQRSPASQGGGTDQFSMISPIESSGGINSVFYFVIDVNEDVQYYGKMNIDSGSPILVATAASTTLGECDWGIVASSNKVYLPCAAGAGNDILLNFNRDLTSFTETTLGATDYGASASSGDTILATNGVGASTDILYTLIVNNGSGDDYGIFRTTGTGSSSTLAQVATTIASTNVRIVDTGTTVILTYDDTGSVIKTRTITKSSNTLSAELYTITWNTQIPQQFDFDGTTFTYKSNSIAQFATSTQSVYWTAAGTQFDPGTLWIETVVNSTSTAIGIDDSLYYWLGGANNIFVSGSSNTWTPRNVTASTTITPPPYEEELNVPLDSSDFTILKGSDVVVIQCDANYIWHYARTYMVGNDDDCSQWQVLDINTNTIGRELFYTATHTLVHAADYTMYNVHVTLATGVPTDYYANIKYDGQTVDQNYFDVTGNVQLRLLYGQCYTIEFRKTLDDSLANSSSLCADDVAFKEAVITTSLGFTFWTAPWGGHHSYNTTSHILTTLVHHAQSPYNYTIIVYNNTSIEIVNDPITGASDLDAQSYNLTAFYTETPIRIKMFNEDGRLFYNQYVDVGGNWFAPVTDAVTANVGDFEGWGLLMFLPIIFAAIFTRNTAGIGGGMIVAFIGVLVTFGLISLPLGILGLLAFVAILGILAYRIIYQ